MRQCKVTIGERIEIWDDVQGIIQSHPQRIPNTYHMEGFKHVIDSWSILPAALPVVVRSNNKAYTVDSFELIQD